MPVKCHFCPAAVPDVEAAIDAGWIPSFWDADLGEENASPVCQPCVRAELVEDEHGEYELPCKPVVVQPPAQ